MKEIPGAPDHLSLEMELAGASVEEVFACWTDPDRLTEWWAPGAEIGDAAGGDYVLEWPLMGWTMRGKLVELEAPTRLAFTWKWDHEPDVPERTVTVELARNGDGTRLRLTHGPYADPEGDDADERDSHREGWESFGEGLRRLLAGG